MGDDPIKAFRDRFGARPAATPASSPASVTARSGTRETYEPFGTKDKVTRLDIRCGNGLAHAVPYAYLLNVTYNWRTYAEIFLVVSGMTVILKGRNLRPIVDAIKLHTCEFVREFDPREFNDPSDSAFPFVESIDVEIMQAGAFKASSKPE